MKILALSDEECPALWDYYQPGRLSEYDLILSCGDLKAEYPDSPANPLTGLFYCADSGHKLTHHQLPHQEEGLLRTR